MESGWYLLAKPSFHLRMKDFGSSPLTTLLGMAAAPSQPGQKAACIAAAISTSGVTCARLSPLHWFTEKPTSPRSSIKIRAPLSTSVVLLKRKAREEEEKGRCKINRRRGSVAVVAVFSLTAACMS